VSLALLHSGKINLALLADERTFRLRKAPLTFT